jgi:hypothetical protein
LSNTGLKDLSAIRAEIKIYQNLNDKNENEAMVSLYDKEGKETKYNELK